MYPSQTRLETFGTADVGRPLHLFEIGRREEAEWRLLVNNAIHPGEPCGVNASIEWATDLLEKNQVPEGVHIAIIPMYNVGGGLRRNCCTRANQNGPESYGFRGNARNLDLNRDFVKCDSRNALAFNRMFTELRPDVFIDTHTSNGADYPAEMTLIATQPDKLGGVLGPWLEQTLIPELNAEMDKAGQPMVPYVHSMGESPEEGIQDFLETPRYSTGYAALHHCIGFTTEAHMLKPFPARVAATRRFLDAALKTVHAHREELQALRKTQERAYSAASHQPVRWSLDTLAVDSLLFTGFEAKKTWSPITQSAQLQYNRDQTWTEYIPHFHTYKASQEAPVPAAYVLPQAWRHVVERLKANGVDMQPISKDTTWVLEVTHVLDHRATSRPYEGHHMRQLLDWERRMEPVQLFAGDWLIPTDQSAARYLVETLSPEAADAFFVWNFFDSALQQKEHFSAYVFHETAASMLENQPELLETFEAAKARKSEGGTAMSPRDQLNWLYRRSPHFEGTSDRYPVFSIPRGQSLPQP